MIETKAALDGAVASLSILDNIINLVRDAKAKGARLSIADIMEKMPSEAFTLAGQIVTKVESLHEKLLQAKVDLGKTISQLEADTDWWRFKKYRLVRAFEAEMTGIARSVGHLFADAVAIAHCRKADRAIAKSFSDTSKQQEQLDGIVRRSVPVGKIISEMLQHARRIRGELGDMIQAFAHDQHHA